jgi:TolA-binding protein
MGIGSDYKYDVHSVVRSNINSLESQVDQLKKKLSSMESSVASMRTDIQALKRNNQMLQNKITNSAQYLLNSGQSTVSAKPRPIHHQLSNQTPNRGSENRMEPIPSRNKRGRIQRAVEKGRIILKKAYIIFGSFCIIIIGAFIFAGLAPLL